VITSLSLLVPEVIQFEPRFVTIQSIGYKRVPDEVVSVPMPILGNELVTDE